jgi:hypothetical protein
MKKWFPDALVACAILMVVSYGFAQSWTQTSAVAYDVISIASSADGNIIMTVGSATPVVSTNRGVTWHPFPSIPPPGYVFGLTQIAMSGDGSKVIANYYYLSVGTVCVSMDLANSWYKTSLQNCGAIAISKDGSKLFAGITGGLIYESTNFGTNWFSIGAPNKTWSCLAVSADGTKIAAGASSDRIYTNSGLVWAATSSPSNSWYSIAASTDGNNLVATGSGGTFVSTNFGSSWARSSLIAGGSVAASADGSLLIFCNNSTIYTSTNHGVNWAQSSVVYYPISVGVSADGCELLSGASQGIWMYQATPSPQLNLTSSSTNLAFSWLIPSTNFVVQQSPDLISWSSITDAPALNFTNLNNELSLSSTNSSGFFRLMSQ